jgi:hypothetical protein
MTTHVSHAGYSQEQSTKDLVMHHGQHIDIANMNAAPKARAESGAAN